ncbi:MAG: carboxypeptidase regulatory-like domain-containing protein [Acidobacteriaceae bacterium]
MTQVSSARRVFLSLSSSRRTFPFILRGMLAGLLLAVLPLLFAGRSCLGQSAGTGTLTGTVTDSKQAVITTATVEVTDVDTGNSRTVPVDGAGLWTAPFLQPGHYKVRVAAGGFATVEKAGLVLAVGRTLTVDATLPPASVSSSVLVTSENPLLDTEKTQVSEELSENMISNLPIAARNWSDFALLTPNTANDGSSGLVSYHGISGLYNSNYVDGANNNQSLFSEARGRASGMPYVYSLDSIQEFQVDAATYSAEFGQAAGGQVNAITRSGTNDMHGDLFYYLRYPSLNALDSYGKAHGNDTQAIKQQQFGGSIGGPFIKNRFFYFFTYDGFRKVAPLAYSSTANISLTPSGTTTNTSVITPTQCPTSISASQCTNAIKYLQSLAGVYPRTGKQDIFFPRLDWQINDKNRVFADFNFANYTLPDGYSASPSYTNLSVTANGNAYYHERFFVTQLTSTLTPRSVNNFLFQWGRDLEAAGANAPGPSVTVSGVQQYGMPNALPRPAEPDEHRLQFTDTFSHEQGRHEWKFGGDANLVHEVMINLFQGGGLYSYAPGNPAAAFQNWVQDVYEVPPTSGSAGYHYTSFTQVYDPITHVGKDDFWMKDPDWFVEDTWKARPNLTLNLGARYDLQITPDPTHPNASSTLATYYTQKLKTVADRVVPRIGAAWTPRNGTVVRAAYGIFAALTQGSTYYAMRVENGVYQTNYNFNCTASNCAGVAGAPEFPNVLFQPPGPPLAAPFSGAVAPAVTPGGSALVTSFHGLDPNFVPPIAHEGQLTVEQELPGKFVISVGYVGSRGLHLPVFIDSNLAPSTSTRTYNLYSASGSQTGTLTMPFYTQRITTADASINTGFSSINSWYNSGVVTVRRPVASGLEFLLNYTWSKATDFGQVGGQYGTFYGGDYPVDPYNIKAEHGLSDLNQSQKFVGSVVYAPPFAHNLSNAPARYLLDGWTISGITTDASGFPITPQLSTYASGGPDGGLTGGTMSSSSGAATGGRAPQVGRNSVPGPDFNNLDMRVSRTFSIHEKVRLQFLAEAFNLLNHANILSEATTGYFFVSPSTATKTNSAGGVTCPTVAASGSSTFNGCIVPEVAPYTSTPLGTSTGTSGVLFTERQLQFSGKLFF